MYTEDDLLPISALQHLAFCERQWALIHLEQAWVENKLTAEGRIMHDRTDQPSTESRGEIRITHGLRLRSLELGLIGKADVVEFHQLSAGSSDENEPEGGVILDGIAGIWRPFPVEYKRGQPKIGRCDEIQVCAQALCLEEMLDAKVPDGALFYGRPWRRYPVTFDDELRDETRELAKRLHTLSQRGKTPPPVYQKKCRSCSLFEVCLPKVATKGNKVSNYITSGIDAHGSLDDSSRKGTS